MLNRQTHNNMTRFFLGDSLPLKVIDKINERKDNPTWTDRMFFDSPTSNPFTPKKYGHRRYNHDPMFNVINGWQMGGLKAIEAHFLHDVEDMISDDLLQKFGYHGRNMIEAGLNWSFSQHRRHDRNRRSYIRRVR